MGLENSKNPSSLRADIQSMRGIAILAVLLYHAGVDVPGGYLGVDVFFVISGYVITSRIIADLDAGSFSAWDFYQRRIRRLLPAALTVFMISAIAARQLLASSELQSFNMQLLGAVFGVGNFVLWQQAGYFDTASQLKPLLHTWSLGVEEQFYLVMPWLLLLASAGLRLWLLLAVTASSLVLFFILEIHAPEAAFYLLPARAWELGMGACGAALFASAKPRRSFWVAVLASAILALVFMYPLELTIRGVVNVAACAATLALLLFPPAILRTGWLAYVLGKMGNISYSLYLVHWPLLAFANNYYAGEALPIELRIQLVLIAFAGAVFLHLSIENPFRGKTVSSRKFVTFIVALLLLILTPLTSRAAAPDIDDWGVERRPNVGLDASCNHEDDSAFQPSSRCSSAESPTLLLWGDSMAMQWASVLKDIGIVQATMSTCGPLLGVSPVYTRELGTSWAQRCLNFNDSVFAWLKKQPRITHVVLSSRFIYYVEPGQRLLTHSGVQPQNIEIAAKALQETINAIRGLGKTVVIIAPPPPGGFDVGLCLERLATGLPMGGRSNCDIEYDDYVKNEASVIGLLRKVETAAAVRLIWPSQLLCTSEICHSTIDDAPMYRDKEHLSYRGVEIFARHFNLPQKLLQE